MLRLVVLALLGICLQALTLAYPANTAVKAPVPGPTKYAACKSLNCPPFRVVQKIASDVELREYPRVWWASAKAQASRITRHVTTPLYWLLRGYIRKSRQTLKSLKMGVPVTRLIESSSGMKAVTMSFYLSVSSPASPPPPTGYKVWLEYKPLLVYVKIFSGRSFCTRLGEGHANILANNLISKGVNGTEFYPPSVKYMTAGYDGPFVPCEQRTNEVWLIKKKPSGTS